MANSDDCHFRNERVSAVTAEMLITNACGPFMQKMALRKLPGARVLMATKWSNYVPLQ